MKNKITILGAGPAGLAAAYYAKKKGIESIVFESNSYTGGNCHTFRENDFLFDCGAHRFHDKNPEITSEIKLLLGEDFSIVNAPSLIFHKNSFLFFPFKVKELFNKIGTRTSLKILLELFISKLTKPEDNFKNFALKSYGKYIADNFLFNYSEKLWGRPCEQLSKEISGTRLKGLRLSSYFKKESHLESSKFYYPRLGYGMICDKLAEGCEKIHLNSKITKVTHKKNIIESITINNNEVIPVNQLISTLPINILISILEPKAPQEILDLIDKIHFRNLILVIIFLNKNSVSNAATMYFPEKNFIFTRISEPKNRSKEMCPNGKTSLIAEIPCGIDDHIWKSNEDKIIKDTISQITKINLIKENEIIDCKLKKISYAYPILSTEHKIHIEKIESYLKNFKNLKTTGRNSKFTYSWLHDMLLSGKKTIDEIN